MFIPRGEIVHESLATSYVLVDALVADLCEGGFSGIVEVVLRDSDSFIAIAGGRVAAVIEKCTDRNSNGGAISYSRATVEQLAERSRRERGRVSIYGYPTATAMAVSGRINAQPLYIGLSTEFTDLEKMIWKLVRERDREWFVDINTQDGPAALIHMRDAQCRVISASGTADSGPLDLTGNAALGRLLDECNRVAGTFDVYFTRPTETIDVPDSPSPPEVAAQSEAAHAASIATEEQIESHPIGSRPLASEPLRSDDLLSASGDDPFVTFQDLNTPGPEPEEKMESLNDPQFVASHTQLSVEASEDTPAAKSAEELIEPPAGDLLRTFVRDELPPVAADAEVMTEVKRLMGEIARVIEEAAQAVGRPDSFSMSLRAGQLKIADRFPFLDPFAGEFEYLAGEIVFVGRASADEFIAGFTEALKLAAETVARSTAYPDRFRAYVAEDLHKLLERERVAFERLGLDKVVEQLLTYDR